MARQNKRKMSEDLLDDLDVPNGTLCYTATSSSNKNRMQQNVQHTLLIPDHVLPDGKPATSQGC